MIQAITTTQLIAHWPLAQDATDRSGNRHNGEASHVAFKPDGAVFNGKDSVIEIPDARSLTLGTGDFTLSAWIHTERTTTDAIGDIVSWFDGTTRRGFSLTVKDNTCGPHNTPNYRHIQFGMDAGTEPQWSFCGRPGHGRIIQAFVVHQGHLYAGVHETNFDQRGHVFRYEEGQRWTDLGAPDHRNVVYSLASFAGKLYVATACDDLVGSLCIPATNLAPGGSIYRLNRDGAWMDIGNPFAMGRTNLAVCGGRLYAKNIHYAGVFRFEQDGRWLPLPTPNVAITSLAGFNGHVYGSPKRLRPDLHPAARHPDPYHTAYRWNGDAACEGCGKGLHGQIYGFAIHRGEVFAGTWPHGKAYCSRNGLDWTDAGGCGCAPLNGEVRGELMGMATYNGKLYAGTLPLAEVYRYDGDHRWAELNRLDFTPDAPIRRAWSMAEFGGRLFVGTLPSGEVHSMEAGKSVMSDSELMPGWRHVAAVRAGDRLRLYLDGSAIATSTPFRSTDFDLGNGAPFQIGFGPHDYFCGKMRDVRVFEGALDAAEIARMYES